MVLLMISHEITAKVQILKELSELVKAVSDPAALPEARAKGFQLIRSRSA